MSSERIIDLAVKEISGSISEEEEAELKELLKESEENKAIYSDTLLRWNSSSEYKPKVLVDAQTSWNSFQARLEQAPKVKVFSLAPFYKVAAAMLVAIGLGLAIYNPWSKVEYSTGPEETLEIVLADNSVITLNELSLLKLSRSFNENERGVEFEGEAYFEIAENPDKPFIIQSRDSEIRVFGTSFNVDSREDNELVEVDVTSGRVSLSEIGNQTNQVILTVGMKGTFSSLNKELVGLNSEDQNFQAWRTDLLVFDDLKLSKVLKDMEEYFRANLSVSNEEILNCTFTSTFSKPKIEEVVEVLSLTLDLEYQKVGEEYIFTGEGCKEVQE